jgi:hypothetical protein
MVNFIKLTSVKILLRCVTFSVKLVGVNRSWLLYIYILEIYLFPADLDKKYTGNMFPTNFSEDSGSQLISS